MIRCPYGDRVDTESSPMERGVGTLASPQCAMDNGTFEALCDNPQVFLQNNNTFDRVRGVVTGATLTITCESPAAVEIEWMVIAERADPFIKQWDRTNPDGYLITQYDAPAAPSPSSEA